MALFPPKVIPVRHAAQNGIKKIAHPTYARWRPNHRKISSSPNDFFGPHSIFFLLPIMYVIKMQVAIAVTADKIKNIIRRYLFKKCGRV